MFLRLVAFSVFLLAAAPSAARDVYYPVMSGVDLESTFEFSVLELIVSKAGGGLRLAPSPVGPANQDRQISLLEDGAGLHVAWFGTSIDLERRLRPVFYPISGGLLGYRLLLIEESRQAAFSEVDTLEDLRALLLGQGEGWADTEILEGAGLRVDTALHKNLFAMVVRGRIDAFPRGAAEAFKELAEQGPTHPGLAIEQDLALHYPFAMLFFVSPQHPDLHDALVRGFERAHRDGSYQELFRTHPLIVDVMDRAGLERRRIFQLENPLMSDAVMAIPRRYWFDPLARGALPDVASDGED